MTAFIGKIYFMHLQTQIYLDCILQRYLIRAKNIKIFIDYYLVLVD